MGKIYFLWTYNFIYHYEWRAIVIFITFDWFHNCCNCIACLLCIVVFLFHVLQRFTVKWNHLHIFNIFALVIFTERITLLMHQILPPWQFYHVNQVTFVREEVGLWSLRIVTNRTHNLVQWIDSYTWLYYCQDEYVELAIF